MAESAELIRLAVFGRPVSHSLSPRIHRAFARQFGLSIDYEAIEAAPDSFRDQLQRLADRGGRGCNVTVPLKNDAWRLASRRSAGSDLAEAANTLTFDDEGWLAENTDGGGLVADLHRFGVRLEGGRVCLLGAGGAAAGVLGALLQQGPATVIVANRTVERARALAERHAGLGPVRAVALGAVMDSGSFDVVINSTAMGHSGQAPPITKGLFSGRALCYDMNYGPASKPLAHRCEEWGIRYADGLGMLVEQAALSFFSWTGKRPETEPVLEALRHAAGK